MGKYQFTGEITVREKYVDVLTAINTPEEAQEYLEACIDHSMSFGNSREQAEQIERSNIGYVSGYFSSQESARILRLFDVEHPVFGKPEQMEKIAPNDAYKAGFKRALD